MSNDPRKGDSMEHTVTVTLGGVYQFSKTFTTKGDAIKAAKRISKETVEPVDVWHNGNCVEMFKNGGKY